MMSWGMFRVRHWTAVAMIRREKKNEKTGAVLPPQIISNRGLKGARCKGTYLLKMLLRSMGIVVNAPKT